MRPLRVTDMFCGAGGFSEGFRQAGFDVTKGLDNWRPAVETHRVNHPETEVFLADILEFDPKEIGPIDVLIGSPPCTEFSFANRGGGGDIEAGLRLVYRFFRFVCELQPRWWIMENVPRVLEFLPTEVPYRKLGIDRKGHFEIPVRMVVLSADYGVPQKRYRAFSGNFPLPQATYFERPDSGQRRWRTLRDVVDELPDPLRKPQLGTLVRDPVYGFDLETDSLTDHFTDSVVLTSKEVSENRAQKTAHAFYGRMSFPDDLDRPARTQMATQLRVSRETTVIGASDGGYRRLTVRESSSVQAFPITYQWWGRSEGLRYKLVGNAVAPPVAYAAAQAILADARRPVPASPYVVKTLVQRLPEPVVSTKARRPLPLNRRFHQHIQSSRLPGFRVDIDNEGKPSAHPSIYTQGRPAPHLVGWEARLFRGSGKAVRDEVVDVGRASEYLARQLLDERDRDRARRFLEEVIATFDRLPDATTMQAVRAERIGAGTSPYEVIEKVDELVQRYFDASPRVVPIDAAGKNRLVPPRSAAALLAAAFVCDVMNRGRSWLADPQSDAYMPEAWVSQKARRRKTRNLDLSRELRRSFERALKKWRPTRAAIEADRLRRAEQLEFPAGS